MKMNKYIFLDIDGVLNSNDYFSSLKHMKRINKLLEMGFNSSVFHGVSSIDPVAVKNLNKLVKDTGAKIVVSSTWRFSPDLSEIFKISGIEAPIFSITPSSRSRIRGEEIQAWLDKKAESPYKYVILDDDSDMLRDQLPYFIQVDRMARGLSENDVKLATKILNS